MGKVLCLPRLFSIALFGIRILGVGENCATMNVVSVFEVTILTESARWITLHFCVPTFFRTPNSSHLCLIS